MKDFKGLTTLIVSLVVGYGIWYMIISFIILEPQITEWHWGTRLLFLIMGAASTNSIMSNP
jgi:hypothetical protein